MNMKTLIAVIVGSFITLTAVMAASRSSLGNIFDSSSEYEMAVNSTGNYTGEIVAWADFDQDGFDDFCEGGGNHLVIYLNQAGQGFTEVWRTNEFSVPCYTGTWRAADVNGDGYPDLVTGNPCESGSGVWVLRNQLGVNGYACTTDHDKSGNTDVGDLLFILDRWGACAS